MKSIQAERVLSPDTGNRLGIVFDISVLDGLQANTLSRTGVFRVVDRLALQLAGRADCRVSFSCNRDLGDIDSLLEEVTQEYPELAGVTAARIWAPPVTVQRYRTIRERVRELRGARPRSLGQKVKLEALRARAALLKRRLRFDAAGLASSGVFRVFGDSCG